MLPPSKRELMFSQRLYNQLLSPLRVVIEHAHSDIKCLRMVADTGRVSTRHSHGRGL